VPDPRVAYEWQPLENLPEDWDAISRPDLDEALHAWQSERQSLRDPLKAEQLEARLRRLWAIETGIIERLYTIDRGTTESLINLGLEALGRFSTTGRVSPQAARLIEDQLAALEFVFAYIRDDRPLSTSYIKELHQMLCRSQTETEAMDPTGRRIMVPLLRGDWKKSPNNPVRSDGLIHQYAPPEHVQDEMDALLAWHHDHLQAGIRPEVEAAWIHHRFTQIHPFQDGNGRVARALATMIFLKAGFLPLVIRDAEHRERYLDALEMADHRDLAPLVNLFSNVESKDLEEAVTFVREMRGAGITSIARAAAGTARRRSDAGQRAVSLLTTTLVESARIKLEEIEAELREAFRDAGVGIEARVFVNDESNEHWWQHNVVAAARVFGYYANLGRQRRWVHLRLKLGLADAATHHIVVSFHHKGVRLGVMAAVAFLVANDVDQDAPESIEFGSAHEFTYSQALRSPVEEFSAWLEPTIRRLLNTWQSWL